MDKKPRFLMPFIEQCASKHDRLPIRFEDYVGLLEHTCYRETNMCMAPKKKPSISSSAQMKIDNKDWTYITMNFEKLFRGPAGSPIAMREFAKATGRVRSPNMKNAQRYFA